MDFGGGSDTVTGTVSAAQMVVDAGRQWTLSSADLTLNEGTGNNDMFVGLTGQGTLLVENGSTLSSDGLYIILANAPGSAGTITVDGATTRWNQTGMLVVGQSAEAAFTIQNDAQLTLGAIAVAQLSGADAQMSVTSGGTLATTGTFDVVGNIAGASGTVTVGGTGSQWTDATGLVIGNYGNGTFSVANSAVTSVGAEIIVGNHAGGTSLLRVFTAWR